MCLVGALPYLRGGLVIISQILGGIASAAAISAITPGDLNVATFLGGGTNVAQGLFLEMFLTAQLVFTIFMLAAEKHKATFIAPVGIGLSLFIAELLGKLHLFSHLQNQTDNFIQQESITLVDLSILPDPLDHLWSFINSPITYIGLDRF